MHCSFNLNNDLRRWVLPLFPFCRWGSGGSGLSSEAPVSCNCGRRFKPESGSWTYISTMPHSLQGTQYAPLPSKTAHSLPVCDTSHKWRLVYADYREMGFLCLPNCWNEWWTLKGITVFSFDERHQLLVCLPWDCFKSSWIKSAFILTI